MGNNDRYRGCLLAGAAGDALGYPVEFMGESAIFARYGKPGIRSYALSGGVAQISDDTQMTLFTAAGLLTWDACGADHGPDGDGLSYIWNSYKDWLRTQTGPAFQAGEPRHCWLTALPELWSSRAPGNTCIGSMMGDRAGSIKAPLNDSLGCGGVMRVAPVGLYLAGRENFTQDQTDLFGAETAALTHGGDLAYMPAALLTHIVSLAVRGDGTPLEEIVEDGVAAIKRLFAHAPRVGRFAALMERAVDLARSGPDDLQAIHALGEGWHGDEALAIGVYCAVRYSGDLERALITAVNHRGDSDSTGAIAGNILGAYLGVDAIPQRFITDLELRDVLLETADDLCAGAEGASGGEWDAKYRRMTYNDHRGPGGERKGTV